MTTGLLNSASTDFDSLFQTGTGTQLFYIYTNAGVDVGQRYLPASMGEAGASCGFKNSAGSDIGPLLCKIGTNWTHAVTVGHYADVSWWHWYGYSEGYCGSIAHGSSGPSLTSIRSEVIDNGDGTYAYYNAIYGDDITEGSSWKATRLDTGKTVTMAQGRNRTTLSDSLFLSSEEYSTIYLYVRQA